MWISFAFLLLLGVAVAVALRVLRPRRPVADTGTCAGCGYSVRGLSALHCPECGADLRETGIVPPGQRLRWSTPWWATGVRGRLLYWTIALAAVAVAVTSLVFAYCVPTVTNALQRYTVSGPKSGQYQQVEFHAHGLHVDSPYRQPHRSLLTEWVDLTLTGPSGQTASLRVAIVDSNRFGYEYTDAAGRRVGEADGFGRDAVLAWMRAAGIDTSGPAVAEEAEQIAWIAQGAAHAAMGQPKKPMAFGVCRDGGYRTYRATLRIAQPLAVFFWLLVWLLGVAWILWRHSRQQPGGTDKRSPRSLSVAG